MKYAGALVFFLCVSVIMTWPLARDGWDAMPGGRGDPLLNTWILMWGYHAITHGKVLSFFDANIFYPAPQTLALSDHMFPNLLIFGPAYGLTQNPVFAYNLVLFLSFALSGFAMFLLAYYTTRAYGPSLVAGFIFAFFPARFAHIGHLQLLNLYWSPPAFLFLDCYLKERQSRDLVLLSLFAALQTWASFYMGYFLLLILAVYYVLFHLWQRLWPWRRDLLAPVLIVVLIFPFAYPYLYLKNFFGFTRELGEVVSYSADAAKSFLSVPGQNWLYGEWLKPFESLQGAAEKMLFTGFLPLALVPVALVRKFRSQKFIVISSAFLMLFAALMALGPVLVWWGVHQKFPLPYLFFYHLLPGFASMRAPSRIMMLGMMPLALLAALALQSRRKELLLAGVALAGVFAEYRVVPGDLTKVAFGEELPPVYRWVRDHSFKGALVEIPAGGAHGEHEYVYFSGYHLKPVINGHSGFFPTYYYEIVSELSRPLSVETLRYLTAIGVSNVILHRTRTNPEPWDRLVAEGHLKEIQRFEEDQLLEINVGAAPGRLQLVRLGLDYVSPASRIIAGLIFRSDGGVWRGKLEGALPIEIAWNGPERFVTESSLVMPLAIQGERWVTFPLETPSTPGQYQVTIQGRGISAQHSVYVTEWGADVYSRGLIQLKDHPVVLRCSINEEIGYHSADGDLTTYWYSSVTQTPALDYQIDVLQQVRSRGVVLHLGPATEDYPRGLEVYISPDGQDWRRIQNLKFAVMLNGRRHSTPAEDFYAVLWPPTEGRYIQLRLTTYDPFRWWSIAETTILGDPLTFPVPTSRSTTELNPQIELVDFEHRGSQIRARVRVKNNGQAIWLRYGPKGVGSVRLGSRWYLNGREIWRSERFELPRALYLGEETVIDAQLSLPPDQGTYLLRLDLVDEGMGWIRGGIEREIQVAAN
ncbi:MAG: discoidin domain-containing protein [Acidobacteria bacterium]|nr:discoidin domain-containing protein [Acidobacteriota bacterium]